MNFATSGMASRLTVEMFRSLAGGLELEMVQYRGGAPAAADLIAGRTPLAAEHAPYYRYREGDPLYPPGDPRNATDAVGGAPGGVRPYARDHDLVDGSTS